MRTGPRTHRAISIGITGHALSPRTVPMIRADIRRHLDLLAPPAGLLTGVSCLARGADTLFAEEILGRAARLEIILPSADYRAVVVHPDHAPAFDDAVARAARVDVLPTPASGPKAYAAANEAMLDRVDHLLAVWDGLATGNEGGTASAVASARSRRIPVTVIWPEGAERSA